MVGTLARRAAEVFRLAFADDGVHRAHFDFEKSFNSFLDVRLRRRERHAEDDLVLLGKQGGLFRDHRREDGVAVFVLERAHAAAPSSVFFFGAARFFGAALASPVLPLKRSWMAFTASCVSTTLPARRTS